jgi:hypothetical protein
MKKLYTILAALLITASTFAQAPAKMSYQAVIRNSSDALVTNQNVGMQISILQTSTTGTAVYVETQTPSANVNGLVSLEIGTGTTTDDFTTIDWANGPYFIKTEIDPAGGTTYTITGTSQLMSVPFALYAKTSGNGAGPIGPQGPAGNDGATGPIGAPGAAGTNGTNGTDGAQGPQGDVGPTGIPGIDGAVGATGPIGAPGAAGTNGTNGTDGAQGPQGAVGPTGIPGIDGAVGATGPIGAPGAAGTNGTNGTDGAQGPQGAVGPTGIPGIDGAVGATGPAGADGQGGVTTSGTGINVTGAGTVGSPYVVSTTSPCSLAIGQTYQGGIIFYLDASGCHGLIAAPSDQSAGIKWDNGSYVDTYAYGNGIGAGEGNSQGIRRWQGTCSSCYASELCQDLSLGGENDWYLPSKYELNLMFENIGQGNALGLGNIGNFANNIYWSSTEYDNFSAWYQSFSTGNQSTTSKYFTSYVRAVRAF